MSELVFIHIGQAGVQMGQSQWELFVNEDKVNNQVTGRLFRETSKGALSRCLMIDCDPDPIDQIRKQLSSSDLPQYSYDSLISDTNAACFSSRGKYGFRNFVYKIEDQVRKQVENCDKFQGFVYNMSVSGGTGSGITSRLISELSVSYNKCCNVGMALYPSNNISNNIVEPYNAVLSFDELRNHLQIVSLFQNEALYRACESQLEIDAINYPDINQYINQLTSSVVRQQLNEVATNLVPYRHYPFVLSSHSKFSSIDSIIEYNVKEITQQLFQEECQFTQCESLIDKTLSNSLFYRGDCNYTNQIQNILDKVPKTEIINHVNKIYLGNKQANIKASKMKVPRKSVGMLSNSEGILPILENQLKKFDSLYQKRAFVHWYVGEGMDSDEIPECKMIYEDYIYNLTELFN